MTDHTIPQDAPLKHCYKCDQAKPATTEYFSRCKGRKDGFQSSCKMCHKIIKDRYRAANKAGIAAQYRIYAAANKERIAEYQRSHYEANKERIADRQRAYYIANKELYRSRERAYYAANKDKTFARQRAWRETNKARLTRQSRVYYEANRESYRVRYQRRRARKLEAEGTHTPADIRIQHKRQKGCCYWCGAKVGEVFQVDHIVPLSRGGSDSADNLVIACPTCNKSKGAKLPSEWPQGGRLL